MWFATKLVASINSKWKYNIKHKMKNNFNDLVLPVDEAFVYRTLQVYGMKWKTRWNEQQSTISQGTSASAQVNNIDINDEKKKRKE